MMNRERLGGQALAEFALVIIAVLLLLFIILETSRVLWGWVTVQSAARDGARYAITGQDDCAPDANRLQCVISTTHRALSTLPLNEDPNAAYEDENYYLIEVYGVNADGQLVPNYAGAPGQTVIVRALYRVPIVTPLLRPIRESLPVFGQVVMNNEQFSNLGGASAGVGLPPPVPEIPTPGVTPSFTPTSTPGATPTPTASPTGTGTPTATRCPTQFEGALVHGQAYADVTGDGWQSPGADITIYDTSVTTTPGVFRIVGSAAFGQHDGHACEGYVRAPVNPPLEGDHVMLVRNDNPGDNSFDTGIVLTGTPTPTPSSTPTASPTSPATSTSTATVSPTPVGPYIVVNPTCGFGPTVQISVQGINWPSGASVNLFWVEEGEVQAYQGAASGPSFQQAWTLHGIEDGNHHIEAHWGGTVKQASFTVPCAGTTATPPPDTPTPTLAPADLTISGPELISTPPIVEYQPLQFGYTIANQGDTDVETQFFTDAFLDPPPGAVLTGTIDLAYSSGYQAISSLPAGVTKVLTITVPLGFTGGLTGTRSVYGMVDSLSQIEDSVETNNITAPLFVADVTPAPSPTPSPTPGGPDTISGQVLAYISNWAPQRRAHVWLVDSSSGAISAGPTETALDGRYSFNGITPGTYDVYACIVVDNQSYVGSRPGVMPPDPFADIFMQHDPLGCPY